MKIRIRYGWFTAAAALWGLALSPGDAPACDLCAVYTGTVEHRAKPGPFLAVTEQYKSFNTLHRNGSEVPNHDGEWLQSSITQIVLGYTATPRLHFQLGVPLIRREFRRSSETGSERGRESGLGDVMLSAHYALVQHIADSGVANLGVFGAVKLPTGDGERLGEELAEAAATAELQGPRHEEGEVSGIHGHDLTLGTGSVDFMIGATGIVTRGRTFFGADVHYMIRNEGDFDYEFADDFEWAMGPGAFVILEHDRTLGLQAELSGETKGKDRQAGAKLDDTALTEVYAGPKVIFTFEDSMHLDLGFAVPIKQNATGLQLLPDYRIRADWSWRF